MTHYVAFRGHYDPNELEKTPRGTHRAVGRADKGSQCTDAQGSEDHGGAAASEGEKGPPAAFDPGDKGS